MATVILINLISAAVVVTIVVTGLALSIIGRRPRVNVLVPRTRLPPLAIDPRHRARG